MKNDDDLGMFDEPPIKIQATLKEVMQEAFWIWILYVVRLFFLDIICHLKKRSLIKELVYRKNWLWYVKKYINKFKICILMKMLNQVVIKWVTTFYFDSRKNDNEIRLSIKFESRVENTDCEMTNELLRYTIWY